MIGNRRTVCSERKHNGPEIIRAVVFALTAKC